MRSPTKILITAAVAACAVGMSACQEQAAAPQDAGAPGTQDGRPAEIGRASCRRPTLSPPPRRG